MPFQVRKIDPLDLQPRKAIGVSLPLSGRAVFNQTYQSKDAIRTNLINYFLTAKGERFMNPLLGNGLRRYIFDQITEEKLKQVESEIKRDISIYFPRVIPINISVVGVPDENTIQFSMTYEIKDTGMEDEVIINFIQ